MNKRDAFFKSLSTESTQDTSSDNYNSLSRFIQLYVPLDYMKHMTMQSKLNMITQFLLTNKTDESKIELIIDLANYYAQKQEWNVVLELINGCTQDSEEFNDQMAKTDPGLAYSMYGNLLGSGIDNLKDFLEFNRSHAGMNKNLNFNDNCSAK